MKDFPNTLCNLAATAMLLGTSMAATAASAGVTGARAGSLRDYEQHKPADAAGGRGRVAANCVPVSVDRVVGGQRVWTQHGVITVDSRTERVTSTECR
jgi:hypothetical protein